ncbi:MAG: DUF3656 domain-containing protein [Cyanobacteriota bacterium]
MAAEREVMVPELLAPAGCWDSLQAAAANGADAVYFGVELFNARLRAENFRQDELPVIMAWLHSRGLKGFLTLNVLIFPDEWEAVVSLLLAAAAAEVDALIVQDIGLARLASDLVPMLPLHASTQMSITSAAGIALAADLGCDRVVLARELTLRDLERLNKQRVERDLHMPLEVFVHGALCVAYSGQCLTSESLGQRSANRGECAQACRLPYQMVVDGTPMDLGDQRYLLSPQDLAAWELLPQLAAAGVSSLKIEGRLKDPSYVAAVSAAYRRGLEQLREQQLREQRLREQPSGATPLQNDPTGELELSFSRGLSSGWLRGVDHRSLVHGRWSKKRGPEIGHLVRVDRGGWWLLQLDRPLKAGDGLVFEGRSADPLQAPEELGGRVMALEQRSGGLQAVRLGPQRLDGSHLRPGAPCWLSSDPALESQWRRMAQRQAPLRTKPLKLRVHGRQGGVLSVTAHDPLRPEQTVVVRSSSALKAATAQALDHDRLSQQLGRLGGSAWHLETLDLDLEPGLFLPVKELNALRRQLVKQLESGHAATAEPGAGDERQRMTLLSQEEAEARLRHHLNNARGPVEPETTDQPRLHVLVRTLEQLRALQGLEVASVLVDLEQPNELREAVAIGAGCWPQGLWLAGARICRPDERWTLEPLLRARPDGYLVRNADQLERLHDRAPCIGDFSLNVANPLSAAYFLERWGLQRVTASHDLALDQLLALADGLPSSRLEVTVHQHMPLFHMEHCLFCAVLSSGHDHTDCGRPCERHAVTLRDRSGVEHPLKVDLGCRNTLFNGRAQTAAEAVPSLLQAGIRHLRLELLEENAAETKQRVHTYQDCLQGKLSGHQLWQREKLLNQLGVTRGTLRRRREATETQRSLR